MKNRLISSGINALAFTIITVVSNIMQKNIQSIYVYIADFTINFLIWYVLIHLAIKHIVKQIEKEVNEKQV